jgi:hypothetical protein
MDARVVGLVVLTASICAVPALAHHSFAMFNQDEMVEVHGAVKEFLWVNPHSWLQVMVTDENGDETEWSIEMSAPSSLARDGWERNSVEPGDIVTVMVHPIRDGSAGGQFVSIMLPDGSELSHVYRDP